MYHGSIEGSWLSWGMRTLTHPPQDKMATILAHNIFKWILLNESDKIPI